LAFAARRSPDVDLIADRPPVCEHPSMTNEITRRDFMNGIAIAIVGAAGVDRCADFEREFRDELTAQR
jgi:hypothetical protein